MSNIRIITPGAGIQCCVCDSYGHIDSNMIIKVNYWWWIHLDDNLYWACTEKCRKRFDLTPLLYSPIDKSYWTVDENTV